KIKKNLCLQPYCTLSATFILATTTPPLILNLQHLGLSVLDAHSDSLIPNTPWRAYTDALAPPTSSVR
ncbi:hypothetical protein S245_043676, partial [Arachis hypogaea]